MKLLLDTDIGSDIDDAVCLAYLLANPACELLGITTVSGQPVERAMLASLLCMAAAKPEIPIYPGAAAPLTGIQRQPLAKQATVLPRWDHKQRFPQGRAVQFMAETIRSSPGEVTLLAIGPMTNVATLFQRHSDVPSMLKGLMLMSGRFGPKPTGAHADHEWNVHCDPVAADVLYRTAVPSHRSVGLDVTLQVQLPDAEVRRRFSKHALLRVVLDMAEVWYADGRVMTFHDPLAAACVFEPELCGFQRGRVSVETDRGVTRWQPDMAGAGVEGADPERRAPETFDPRRPSLEGRASAGPHEVALTVNPERFFDVYFEAFVT